MKTSKDQRRRKGEGSLFCSGGYWQYTFGYTANGEQRKKKKCLGSVNEIKSEQSAWTIARQFRDKWIAEIKNSNGMTANAEKVTCDQFLTAYIDSLKRKNKPSAYVIEKCIEKHVRPYYGTKRVASLERRHFEDYEKKRVESDGVSKSTVDHDHAYLRSALILAHKTDPKLVPRIPHIPMAREGNVREGFLEWADYETVLTELPLSLKCMMVVAYHIGNRKGVLLNLKWAQIDFKEGVIWFMRMKNRKPVPVAAPIYGDMRDWLLHQHAFQTKHFPNCEHVFFWYPADCEIDPTFKTGRGGRRNEPGTPIKSFYESWDAAVAKAGFPDLLFHDLRRSAVRNLVQKIGVSEKRAMEISGHKTRSMLDRYNIVSLADIKESGEKADAWVRKQRSEGTKTGSVLKRNKKLSTT